MKNETFLQRMWDEVVEFGGNLLENIPGLIWDILLSVVIWFLARFLIKTISKLTAKAIAEAKQKDGPPETARHTTSVMTLTRSVARYVIYFAAILAILQVFNVSAAMTLLGTAGIGSIAIGFGAQSLVKDILAGLFIVFENQYSVGDYVRLNTDAGTSEGTVEAIAMRVTYLRNYLGEQFVIPNGSIRQVVNCTRGGWLAVVDVPISYEQDARKAMEVLLEAANACADAFPDIVIERPSVQGIRSFDESSMGLRVVCRAQATQQWQLERNLRLYIKEAFDKNGIEIPYNRLVVLTGAAAEQQAQAVPNSSFQTLDEWIKNQKKADGVPQASQLDNEEDRTEEEEEGRND